MCNDKLKNKKYFKSRINIKDISDCNEDVDTIIIQGLTEIEPRTARSRTQGASH